MGPFEQIEKFYREIVRLPIPSEPTRLTPEQKLSAVEHWREEIKEFEDAQSIDDEIDACIDLAWLALGRVIEMGAHLPEHFAEVARANMDRVPGRNPKRPNSTGFDTVKPEGWRGPDHYAVLSRSYTMPPEARRTGYQQLEDLLAWLCQREPVGHAFALHIDGKCYTVEHPGLLRRTLTGMSCEAKGVPNGSPKIILVGHGRHGKDTVAEMLRDRYGYKFTSSSLACAESVMLPAFREIGVEYRPFTPPGESEPVSAAEACFRDRHGESELAGDHRTFWFEQIKRFCTPDKSRLAKAIFAENDMYVGIRDRRELWAAKLIPGTVTIWVDASDRLPPEQGSSMNIEPWMADLVLDNNGDLADLERNVVALMGEVHS